MRSVKEVLFPGSLQPSYSEKLNHPLWKAKRREILSGINFCQSCKRGSVPLQLHHNFYDRNKEPWEYDNKDFKVLCSVCHKKFTDELIFFRRDVLPRMNVQAMRVLNRALSIGLQHNDPLIIAYAIGAVVSNPEKAKELAKVFEK